MPKVVIEYELPREQEAVEAALLGAEAIETLRKLRTWLAGAAQRKRPPAGATDTYQGGLSAVREWLDRVDPDDASDSAHDDEDDD